MLTANDIIHGWSPAGDDDVEVNVSQDMYFMSISPSMSSTSSLSSVCPPLNATIPTFCQPLSQSEEFLRPAIAPSSDRRAQRNRNRDPSWIPRPRNAFIIFRCEYSREHAQGSQGSQDDHDSGAAVKTLSKRAAEAWRKLPPSEKERYKVLADMERDDHARTYPHYRFRPMKRQTSGTRKGGVSCPPMPHVTATPLTQPSPYPVDRVGTNHEEPSPPSQEELEQAEALEAYAIGLYNHDLFSPFTFPECY